jgi:hypothetical protein
MGLVRAGSGAPVGGGGTSQMPVSYTLDQAAGLIRTRCSGDVTLSEVLHHFQELKEDPERPSNLDVFLDLREMTSSPTAGEIRQAGWGPHDVRGVIRFGYCAIVAEREILYAMARMWEMLVENFFLEVVVFRSASEAEIWLAVKRAQTPSAPASRHA